MPTDARAPEPSPPAALPTTDELYRLLVETLTDYAVVLLTRDGRIASWNEGAARMLGWGEAEILGAELARFYPAEDAARGAPAHDLRLAADEGRCDALAWRVRADGSRLWATTVLTAMRDAAGALVGFGLVMRDLTDRKEAADRYEESRQRWRSLFEHNPDPVLSLDLDGGIVAVNPAAATLLGHSAEELAGAPVWFLVVEEQRDVLRAEFARAAGGEPRHLELIRAEPGGEARYLSASLAPIVVGETILGVYCIAQDVTARKAAEREREALLLRERVARAEAEAANRAKGDFLAVVSHELRTPLTAISGYADLLADGDVGPVTESQQRQLERIRAQARHLGRMVDDLLGYVRLDAGEELPGFAVADLHEIVRAVADGAARAAGERQLALRLDVPAGALLVRTDRARTVQLLEQLLSNAVKFTEAGEVHVVVRTEPGAVAVDVRDTGIGIAPEALERIWEPFWQAEDPLVRRAGGTGLGLSIVRRIADLLGAEVSVRSELGRGSTYTLRIAHPEHSMP